MLGEPVEHRIVERLRRAAPHMPSVSGKEVCSQHGDQTARQQKDSESRVEVLGDAANAAYCRENKIPEELCAAATLWISATIALVRILSVFSG
jgi:hypothetical protein